MVGWTEVPLESTPDPFVGAPRPLTSGLDAGWLLEGTRSESEPSGARFESPRGRSRLHWPRRSSAPGQNPRPLGVSLQPWPVHDWLEVCGPHLFAGATGAGKTTLVMSVAQALVRRGKRVQVVSLLTPEPARRTAVTWLAAEAGVRVTFADDRATLDAVLASTASLDALLFDTPCLLGTHTLLQALLQHSFLRHPRTVLHLCLSFVHSEATQKRVLRLAAPLFFDCIAVSHLDLADGTDVWVPPSASAPCRLSFTRSSPDPGVAPSLVGPHARAAFPA